MNILGKSGGVIFSTTGSGSTGIDRKWMLYSDRAECTRCPFVITGRDATMAELREHDAEHADEA